MQQHHIAIWLKSACILAAVLGVVVFFIAAPWLAETSALAFPAFRYLKWPGLVWVWGIAVLCYLALWRFWGVCSRIAADRSFSQENAQAMLHIARLLWASAGMSLVLAIVLYTLKLISAQVLGRGNLWMLLLLVFMFSGIALLSQALGLLVHKAANLQADQDLTI
jgi:hypothetical protein